MANPTVRGSPHFNTAGYYVHIRVKIADNVAQPAPAAPPNPGDPPIPAVHVTMVRVWGMSQATDKRCSDNRNQTSSKIDDWYPALPWDSDDDWLDHWFLYDSTDAYYRICVETSLSDGTHSYKCAVWKISSTLLGSTVLPEVELKDC